MNYKVVLYNISDAGTTDYAGNFEFYTQDEAIECCQEWVAVTAIHKAYLWDGDTWRFYT